MPGLLITLFLGAADKKRQSTGLQVTKWFGVVFTLAVQYFCNKMMRLLILMGPVASLLAGIALATIGEWCFDQFGMGWDLLVGLLDGDNANVAPAPEAEKEKGDDNGKKKKGADKKSSSSSSSSSSSGSSKSDHVLSLYGLDMLIPVWNEVAALYQSRGARVTRVVLAALILVSTVSQAMSFHAHAVTYAAHNSQPSIVFKAQLNDGKEAIIRDYLESYEWLKEHTPTDARVLSWWDYGYQISGIGNRTTLADGNTWNLEHIALIGRILTSPEKKAHELARHLADYVLVWAGRHGDDLGKVS